MDVRVGLWRKLSAEELMLLNCGIGEDSWESLGLQGDPTSPFWRKSALGFLWREWAKAETLVLWPPHAKSWLTGKDSEAGRDWGQEEKGMTEDETAGWHHQLNGHEFGWTPGVGDGQGSLACCDSWGHKELDMTERLNWTDDFFCLLIKTWPCKYMNFRLPERFKSVGMELRRNHKCPLWHPVDWSYDWREEIVEKRLKRYSVLRLT